MRARLLQGAVLGSALALAGCATQTPPVRVTRFHLDQPIARAQIAVEPRLARDNASLEYRTYASIVGAELASAGFTEAPGVAASELVAVIDVQRGTRDGGPRRSPISIGLGGSTGGYRSGVGGGISFPLGRGKSRDVVGTQLSVQIKRRSDATVIWEGRAEGEALSDDPAAEPSEAVRRLAAALFKGFPGESGRTITVK